MTAARANLLCSRLSRRESRLASPTRRSLFPRTSCVLASDPYTSGASTRIVWRWLRSVSPRLELSVRCNKDLAELHKLELSPKSVHIMGSMERICWQLRASVLIFFFQAEDGIRDLIVTGVQTCALPISRGGGQLHLASRVRLRRTCRLPARGEHQGAQVLGAQARGTCQQRARTDRIHAREHKANPLRGYAPRRRREWCRRRRRSVRSSRDRTP